MLVTMKICGNMGGKQSGMDRLPLGRLKLPLIHCKSSTGGDSLPTKLPITNSYKLMQTQLSPGFASQLVGFRRMCAKSQERARSNMKHS